MRLLDETPYNPYPKETIRVSSDGPGATASVKIVPGAVRAMGDPLTLDDFNERIMKPASESAALACRNDMIASMIEQLRAFLDPNGNPDEKQLKRLGKASKQLRKMGWPKTVSDAATWRKVNGATS